MHITFIQTGGTIDKDYPQGETNHGYEFEIGEPAVSSILDRAKLDFEFEIVRLLQKDSLDIEDQDRDKICQAVLACADDKIIITHGTDTIEQTAKTLLGLENKTIVLTGAMLPEKFYDSDADFNLGMAAGCVQTAQAGVYIVLHGMVRRINE